MRSLSWILVTLALALAACEDEARRADPPATEKAPGYHNKAENYAKAKAAKARIEAAKAAAEAELPTAAQIEAERRAIEEQMRAVEELEQAVEDAKTEADRQAALKRLGEAKVEAKKGPKPRNGVKLSDDCLNNPLGC